MDSSPFKGTRGLRRIRLAFGYSMQGLGSAFRHEAAFRQELILAIILIPLALWLDVEAIHKALMIASVLLVLMVELLNAAIEATVDRISLDRHSLAKRAKDLGSAAVFISLLNVALVWGIILWARYGSAVT